MTSGKVYSLKRRALRRWLRRRKTDPIIMSNRLHLRVSVFKRMLKEKKPFTETQIRRLVYFMGARSAFDVIYFTTPEERERVRKETFGKGEGYGKQRRKKNAQ